MNNLFLSLNLYKIENGVIRNVSQNILANYYNDQKFCNYDNFNNF